MCERTPAVVEEAAGEGVKAARDRIHDRHLSHSLDGHEEHELADELVVFKCAHGWQESGLRP
jgi:hypothetical protein